MKYLLLAAAAAAFIPAATPAFAKPQQGRISMARARAVALSAVPLGVVRSAELEREKGRLIYSFDIAVRGRAGVQEVQVSAIDGRLVSVSHENPADERAEHRAEAREHKKQ
jgi:uncharacterized membrane protein YkoI